ncbi:putative serine/threonine-protein kinase [Brachypodium distachyon]|uniref:putative serine/threonine-protein kinase n=1 Tax=Brachypodium distachyon TaxID=15368 RepID=UPI000D0CD3B1|nr:putative serine/threonine-protein kinase [Brachypodium distachyon]|eukprot:XP_024316580.1 putative serine/threonine-protein kinase [Brachypodium distachyon]
MAMIKRCLCRSEEDIKGLLRTKSIQFFSYKQIKRATNNFERTNKLGRGGFGTVYKGIFVDGTAFAAKVLSSESKQGIEEFLTEIESLTEAKHANLVRLLGCCVQKQNRVLVYEYAENNSLDHALKGDGAANLPWSVRSDICIGTARGLSFLHEEHEPSIVHRDIKASNVLLDRNFVPKIADFGLAKLFPDNITHISTRVVGTTGYLAPEYFVHGQLTKKADVYSFGVLVLEIISGQRVPQTIGPSDTFLVRQAWLLYQEDRLLEMVDASIKDDCPEAEVLRYAKVGLACTQAAPAGRPTMSQVVKMLSWPDTFWKLETRPTDHLGCAEAEPVCPGVSLSAGSLRARWPTAAIPTTSSANSGSVTCSEIVPR